MPQIKPSTDAQFPIGCKVKIVDSGQVCSTYKDMALYMKLEEKGFNWAKGRNVLNNGDVGVVVAKAMHESECYGEMLAVKVGDQVSLIVAKRGVVEYEEPVVIGKPKLAQYDLAPLTPDAYDDLLKHVADAPKWATHIGSDSYGVHFFDHHPHIYHSAISRDSNTFLKGLLPPSHKHQCVRNSTSSDALKVMVIPALPFIKMEDMKEGQVVRLASEGNACHTHWGFKVDSDYTVGEQYGSVGPVNPDGNVPSRNWAGWTWLLVEDVKEPVVVEPTVEELKAELAAVKAKLWEAEWKLNKIVETAQNSIK